MKKKNVIIISIITILLVVSILLLLNPSKNNPSHKVTITQYKLGTDKVIKTITIDKERDIEELEKYIKDLKPLGQYEHVNLAFVQEIEINYDDSIRISIYLVEKGYCIFSNKKENTSGTSRMPKGLYDWVKNRIK